MTTASPDIASASQTEGAARINQRRKDLGLSLEDLAERAEVGIAYVTNRLLGDKRLTGACVAVFAHALDCTIGDLINVTPVDDARVEADSYVVYPDRYDDIPYADRHDWVLTVVNGHTEGRTATWSIRRGLGATHGTLAMNGDGTWELESRHADNTSRRWTRDDALAIALLNVNTHKVQGLSAAEAIAEGEKARA